MKNLIRLCALSVAVAGFSTAIAGDQARLDAVRAKFTERFPQIDPSNVGYGPVDGMLMIRQGTLIAYLSDDGRYLFQGELIDLETDTNLTEQAASVARKEMMSTVDKGSMIVFGPDQPRQSVAVFTDIDCTFCRKLHREIDQYIAAGIEIRYLMYPRSGPGSEAWAKAEEVVCAEDRNDAITRAKNDQPVEADKCALASVVDEHYRLGQAVGLRGTPAIVLEDGEMLAGYVPAAELARRLSQPAGTQ